MSQDDRGVSDEAYSIVTPYVESCLNIIRQEHDDEKTDEDTMG